MSEPARSEPTPFERFKRLAERVVSVPKTDADAAYREIKAERASKRSKPPKKKAA